MFGSGKVSLEMGLEREVFYHGEDIPLNISINNQSKKAIKNIRVGARRDAEHRLITIVICAFLVSHQPEL